MNDTRLGDWMRSLPRTKASPGFTSEVLRKARAKEVRVPFVWRMAAAAAMAACLVAIVQVAILDSNAQRQKYELLRAEQQQLEAELQAVKKIADDAEPMVVLENDEGTRVIMDFESISSESLTSQSEIQPASYTTFD